MRWIKRVMLAAAGIAVVALVVRGWMPKPVRVESATASRGALDVEVSEDGQTRVRDRFVISAPVGGTLERVSLEPGMHVTAGSTLAAIEPPAPALLDARTRREAEARLQAALAHERGATAAIARAEAARDSGVREADRARGLLARGAITASERDRLETEEQLAIRGLAAAEADHLAALAEISAARAAIGNGRAGGSSSTIPVQSPVDGVVLRVLRESSGPIAAGSPILELGDTAAIEVVVDVLSSDAARVTPGMPCVVSGWGGDELTGTVRRVEPSAFTRISALGVEEQRVKVIVAVPKAPLALGDGFRVDARIITWHGDNVLTVPAGAVFRDHERWAVYTIRDGKAQLVHVDLGHRGRLNVEVTSGLAEGSTIVLHPSDSVRDGTAVVGAGR